METRTPDDDMWLTAARVVGYVLSPLTLPPLLIGWILWHFGAGLSEISAVVGNVFVLLTVTPAALLLWMVRSGRATSAQVEDRAARTWLLVAALACGLVATAAVFRFGETVTALILVLLFAYLISIVALVIINRLWKVSLHSAAAAGCAVAILFVGTATWQTAHAEMGLSVFAGTSILIPVVVGWARLRQGVHTIAEVVGGWTIGALLTLAQLAAADRLGLMAGA